MYRRTRIAVLTALVASATALGPVALTQSSAAAPTATCSLSGLLPNGKVHVSGGGYEPGRVFVFNSTELEGASVEVMNGGFTLKDQTNGKYIIFQNNKQTECLNSPAVEKPGN
ncbi:hypothetical protein [Streptomyces sp. NPDC000410]|uniref:hypothetical protein n=1 Tax=Streptomyces sp. NPDC000410 TaxID=3154254 RepID=UPI00332A68BC